MKNLRAGVGAVLLIALSLFISDSVFAASTTPAFTRNLSTGTRGGDVSSLQKFLISNSNLRITAPTGYYGPLTTSAVAQWQKSQGIPATGTVGPISRGKLNSNLVASTPVAATASTGSTGSSDNSVIVAVPSGFVETLSQLVSAQATSSDATTTATEIVAVSGGSSSISSSPSSSSGSSSSSKKRRASMPSSSVSSTNSTFTTITSTSPADGATNAPRNQGARITFSQGMDASTVNTSNIIVTANDVPVAGTMTYSSIGNSAAFVPDASFGANVHVMVTVSPNVLSLSGSGLSDEYVFEFDTASSLDVQSDINLSTAASYGILATGLSNINPTLITGSIGTGSGGQSASPSLTNGSNHANDSSYTTANLDLNNAFTDANTRVCDSKESGSVDLGGRTFTPGVYCFGGPNTLTGTTTLSGSGVFIFKLNGSFSMAASSTIRVANGAHPSKVYWVVNDTSLITTGSRFLGNLLANGTTTLNGNSFFDGRLLSRSTVTTTGTTTTSVPGTIYCSTVRPYTNTSQAPAPNNTFTVAYIATGSTTVAGTIDANTCDIGVYIPNGASVTVNNASIHDAGKSGIFNDVGDLTMSSSTIYQIGDHITVGGAWRFGGTQTGLAINFMPGSTGSIIGNNIYNYQKAGIVLHTASTVLVRDNTITGNGTTTVNAQIGLQIGFSPAMLTSLNVGNFTGNIITDHIYTPADSATGILGQMASGQNDVTLTAALTAANPLTVRNGIVPESNIVVLP